MVHHLVLKNKIKTMKNLIILITLLVSLVSCNKNNSHNITTINDDKGIVIAVWWDIHYYVTVKTKEDPDIERNSTVFTFITDKPYNINDTVYFTK